MLTLLTAVVVDIVSFFPLDIVAYDLKDDSKLNLKQYPTYICGCRYRLCYTIQKSQISKIIFTVQFHYTFVFVYKACKSIKIYTFMVKNIHKVHNAYL